MFKMLVILLSSVLECLLNLCHRIFCYFNNMYLYGVSSFEHTEPEECSQPTAINVPNPHKRGDQTELGPRGLLETPSMNYSQPYSYTTYSQPVHLEFMSI